MKQVGHGLTFGRVQKLVAVCCWVLLAAWGWWYVERHDLEGIALVEALWRWLVETPWAPLLYVAVYQLRSFLLLPATPFNIVAGMVFGFWGGLWWVAVAENLSSSIGYWLAKWLRPPWVVAMVEQGDQKWKKALRRQGWLTVLTMRLWYLHLELVSYIAGLGGVSWRAFASATALGLLPGMVAFVGLGASIEGAAGLQLADLRLQPHMLVVSGLVMGVGLGLAWWLGRRGR